ncbi:MAG: sigma-70 family RNA polymerase sigma factor [Planctomycetota bacterium]
MTSEQTQVTQLLGKVRNGDRAALDALLPVVYEDLHEMAERFMRRENRGHTLQPTAIVHEAYLRLVDQRAAHFDDRAHFYAAAATLIRRILVDHARARQAAKRGGDWRRLTIEAGPEAADSSPIDLIALEEALDRLAELNPRQARIVELRFYGGLTTDQAATVLDLSKRSADRSWQGAKAWLFRALTGEPTKGTDS